MSSTQTRSVFSKFFLVFLFGLSFFQVFANENENEDGLGGVRGRVTTTDNKPAELVTVSLKGTKKSTLTGDDGSFIIRNVQPGSYDLEISLVGYETLSDTVTIEANKNVQVTLELKVSDKQLQEVIVSAGTNGYKSNVPSSTLRLQTPLLEVPQSIQIVTSKVLKDQQILSMSDGVIRNVSGAMRLEHWGDMYTNINMRGSRASEFRNGMNIITSYWSPLTQDMSFVDHVEFVKGPAGFIMSVGEPSGIFNVVTKKPTGINKGEASFTMGSYDLYRATLDFDGKFDKDGKVLYRLNIAGQTQNSFRDFEYNNRYAIAPVIAYKIDDKTTLTAEYNIQKVKSSNVGSFYVFSTEGYATQPRNFTLLDPGIEPTYITDQSITVNLQHRFNDSWKVTAQVAYFDYKGQGTSMWPTYDFTKPTVAADSLRRDVSIWDAAATAKIGQVFLNGNVETGKVKHRILVGLDANDKEYYADWNQYHSLDTDENWFKYNSPSYGFPSNGYPVWDRSKSLVQRAGIYGHVAQSYTGVYVQDELGFFDNVLRVTLAGRYSNVKNISYGTPSTAEKVTPRLGASVSIDKQTSVYALYDQAFTPQSGAKRDGGAIKPLTGSNMEVGIKKDWMGGKWSSGIAVYRIIKNNENSTDPSDPTGRYVVQLGQTRAQGVELDIRGEIFPGLTATANYAYTDNQVTEADSSGAAQLTVGNKVPGYAKHTANAWLNYRINSGVLKGIGISGGFTFLGERSTWAWAGDVKEDQLPDYTKFDAGIFWDKERFRVALNVYNLANTYLYTGASYGSYYYWQAEAGRNWRLGVTYRF